MPYFSGPNGIREVADPGERLMQSFQDSRKKRLLSDYFRTGQADLGQLAKYDPEAAQQIQAQQKQQGLAKMFADLYAAPEDQRPQGIAALLAKDPQMGMEAAKMFDPRFQKNQAEQFTLTPGSARYGPDGTLLVAQPYEQKPQSATFQKDAEGNGWWLRPGEAPIPADGVNAPADNGAAAGLDQPGYGAADFTNPDDFYAAIGGIIGPHGGRITSTNGGKHNPGSLHPGGGAVDVGMGRETPEQQAKILAALQGDPRWLVRDERQRPQGQGVWSGPHLHVERRSGGSGGSGQSRINFGKAEQPKFQARQYGNDEIAAMGLPPGTVAYSSEDGTPKIVSKPDAASQQYTPQQRLNAQKVLQAAGKQQANIENIRTGLVRMRKALNALNTGMPFSTGTGLLQGRVSALGPEGQELQSAVGAIQNSMLALTRVPGVGTQSDRDSIVDERRYPSLTVDKSVNENTMKQLEDFAANLLGSFETETRSAQEIARGGQPQQQAPAGGGYRVGQIIQQGGKRYRVTGGDPNDPDVEEVR